MNNAPVNRFPDAVGYLSSYHLLLTEQFSLCLILFVFIRIELFLPINHSFTMAARRGSPNGKPETDEVAYDYQQEDVDQVLHRARTTGAVSISAELFEKLYLSPKNEVSGQLRRTFGNPTPMYVKASELLQPRCPISLETCCPNALFSTAASLASSCA